MRECVRVSVWHNSPARAFCVFRIKRLSTTLNKHKIERFKHFVTTCIFAVSIEPRYKLDRFVSGLGDQEEQQSVDCEVVMNTQDRCVHAQHS